MYKIVAADLDGTLLRNDKTISPLTREELERINDLGVIFLPSTGRTHVEIPKPVMELPFLNYGLCVNGGAIYDYKEEKYIFQTTIPVETAIEVYHFLKDYPVCPSCVINGRRLVQGDEDGEISDFIKGVMAKGILFNCTGVYDMESEIRKINDDIQKMLVYTLDPKYREEVMKALNDRFPQLQISSSGPSFIEVNANGIDKGVALKRFCELKGVAIEDTMVFGDAENDISMLKAGGLSVVMENGSEETKAVADVICPSNEDDGVALTLQKYIY